MAGENETTTTETVEQTTVADQATETQETAQTTETPHPLQPGGVRFEEVYGKWKAEERAAQMLREENDRLRTQPPQSPQTQTPQTYSQDQLQKWVDEGRITPAQMAGQLALQASAATEQRIEQKYEQRARAETARADVNAYIAKVPALANPSSAEFHRVATEAHRISQEINLPTTDVRVQRLALVAALGPIDRITSAERTREYDRRHADTHTETGGGGGTRQTQADPLKNVEPARIEFWKSRGYTREQMIEEARFIRRPLRNR